MKNYFSDVNKNYSIYKTLFIAIPIAVLLIVLDALQVFSMLIARYNLVAVLTVVLGILALVAVKLLENDFFDLIYMNSTNAFDGAMVMLLLIVLIYCAGILCAGQFYVYKAVVIFAILALVVAVLFYRYKKFSANSKKAQQYQGNTYDLKELYYGQIKKIETDAPVLLDERDVDYDLLDRDMVINYLYTSVIETNPTKKFVISLEGAWGSGKTTLINNVKQRIARYHDDVIVIDEFDPWMYSNVKSLLISMFSVIISKTGFKYNMLSTTKLAESFTGLFLNAHRQNMVESIFVDNSVRHIKYKLNNYLKLAGKKVVFFIDNIDRADKENVVLLFKLVGNVFDFDRVTYVLSFDERRVKKIFEEDLNVDYEYLEKIIQLQIRVPEISRGTLKTLYTKSIINLLKASNQEVEQAEYDSVISHMVRQKVNIRDFKRFLNSALNFSFKMNDYLYMRDMIALEYIKMFNFPLYLEIYDNRDYFIKYDKIYDAELFQYELNVAEFNESGKIYFKKLFSKEENKGFLELLAELFPYVDAFKNDEELKHGNYTTLDEAYSEIAKYRRVCSAKYFELYFTNGSNQFIEIGKSVEKFVTNLRQSDTLKDKENYLKGALNEIDGAYHKAFFEKLQVYINEISERDVFDLCNILIQNSELIEDGSPIGFLGAKHKSEDIIGELMIRVSKPDYRELIAAIKADDKNIKNFRLFEGVINRLRHYKGNKEIEERAQLFSATCHDMAQKIIDEDIDLYADQYYATYNLWALYHFIDSNQEMIQAYVKSVLSANGVFRFIYDLLDAWQGGYCVNEKYLKTMISESRLDAILQTAEPKTEDEAFVLKVYQAYKNSSGDDKKGITLSEPKRLHL